MVWKGSANTSDANTSKIDDLGFIKSWLLSVLIFHFSHFFSGEKMKHVDRCMVHLVPGYMTWLKRGSCICMQIVHYLWLITRMDFIVIVVIIIVRLLEPRGRVPKMKVRKYPADFATIETTQPFVSH